MISTSAADDRAYRALANICGLAATVEHRIIGGHMVRLLLLAYPTGRATERSNADADIGIDIALAGSGHLHHALTTAGYEATSNRRRSR
ncbi:hypothetical protein [Rhodococcus sp. H29-C3]|uniref:hypothetical protein n=1 Tax=Rhodococcus sp. H29-C3 TaxID=3046307 RepID=UPI0024BBDA85|nr:hypothetical protein [Rhodococcus sp. H29-C3]MDJ0363434.1 hypothetical protein [Rhodococcus sp. H29-C3]